MDDFLYIIIGILWVVYSLYTSKQKKERRRALEEQRKAGGPVVQPKRSIIEEFLDPEGSKPEITEDEYSREIFQGGTMEEREAEVLETFVENQSLETIEEEVSAAYFEQQYRARARVDTVMPDRVQPMIAEEEFADNQEEEFDLRKAVIYAEILNPRYV